MAIWRRKPGDPKPSARAGLLKASTHGVYLAPDDRGLAVVRNNIMTVYRLRGDQLTLYDLPPTKIKGSQPISWSTSGELLAYIDHHSVLRLLRWSTGESVELPDASTTAVALDANGSYVATIGRDGLKVYEGTSGVISVPFGDTSRRIDRGSRLSFSPDGRRFAATTGDRKIVVYNVAQWKILAELAIEDLILDLEWVDNDLLACCVRDGTLRFWSLPSGRPKGALEVDGVPVGLQYAPHHQVLLVWTPSRLITYSSVGLHFLRQEDLSIASNRTVAASARSDLLVRLAATPSPGITLSRGPITSAEHRPRVISTYANAKILLLGDSGVGKSGLALVLVGKEFKPTESTHARHVWRVPVPALENEDAAQREVLLWDLAGQPGYRVVHQLHLRQADAALVLFDSRSETTPLAGIGYWARALRNAQGLRGRGAAPIPTFLVAARTDRGVVGVSDERLAAVVEEFEFEALHSTSAREGNGVAELREAVLGAIDWSRIPVVTSSVLFAAVKSFVLDQKAAGSLLPPLSALHAAFRTAPVTGPAAEAAPGARLGSDLIDGEPDNTDLRGVFEGCVARLESAGLVKQLAFGDLVLLQPELLDVYAGAIVNAARAEPDGLGTVLEAQVLNVEFSVPDNEGIRDVRQERLLVIATVEELLRHEVVLREETEAGTALVFPEAFRRDLPSAEEPSGDRVEFRFDGPVAVIYATLVVRLSRTERFTRRDLWQSAAQFAAEVGGLCTVHLTQADEGRGALQLAFGNEMAPIVRLQCEQFVQAHLDRRATPGTVERERLYSCPDCRTPFSREQVRAVRSKGRTSLLCPVDETRVSLEEHGPGGVDEAARAMDASADAARSVAAATSVVRGKEETSDFDVFLCHNVADKPAVRELGLDLRKRGLLPWLDEEQLRPGRPWQQELERVIDSIGTAALLVGPRGVGPWQNQEIMAFLRMFVERDCPVIPVLLPGGHRPDLPLLLHGMTWVDLAADDALDRLVWGITGERPWLLS
jgi:GTPase SAR1 family protein